MNKTEIENKIYDLKRTIKSCENIIKANENEIKKLEAEKERPAFERVEKGLCYYGIEVNCLGATAESYVDNRSVFSGATFKNNNYFLTKERAEEVAYKINFLLKLERLHDTYCPDYKPDWSDASHARWCVAFDHEKEKYVLCWDWAADCKTVYFDSEETVKKVYETLNKEIENETL